MQVRKQQLELDMKQQAGSKSQKDAQGYLLSQCLFNLYTDYIKRNARQHETQVGINIAGRNINNLRYADDTTFMAESEELKSLLIEMKEETKNAGLTLNIHISKIMEFSPITSWQIDGGNNGNSERLYFGGTPKSLQIMTTAMKLKDTCSLEGKL